MDYTNKYHQLKEQFKPGTDIPEFSGSGISCHWTSFESVNVSSLAEERNQFVHHTGGLNSIPDAAIPENRTFSYPVFLNSDRAKRKQAIILLHGLNERSWIKYLVWAYYLAEKTGRPVILFPIAFHMNRSPAEWGNPRAMTTLLMTRRQRLGEVPMSTFANVALSERLCEDPLRFFTSGQQSAADLIQLTLQLRNGEHPLFERNTTVDMFAYSIGAFLAQILFLSNPNGLYTDSRLFLFCGGALFDQMNGVSKLIMDQRAFDRLRQFYIIELSDETERSDTLAKSLHQSELGQAFLAMLAVGNLEMFRKDAFYSMQGQIRSVALKKDKVIPTSGIWDTLNNGKNVEILDFPYPYSHEIPFPVADGTVSSATVDRSFESVFFKATEFLM